MREYESNNYKVFNASINEEVIRLRRSNQRSLSLSFFYYVLSFLAIVLVIALILYIYDYHTSRPETLVSESHSDINGTMNSPSALIDITQDWTIYDYILISHDQRVVTGTVYNKQSYPAPLRQYCYIEVNSQDKIDLIKIKSGVAIEVTNQEDFIFIVENYCAIDDVQQFL
jgi:hypothetical protein